MCLSYIDVSLPLPPSLPLSLKINNIFFKEVETNANFLNIVKPTNSESASTQ